MKRLFPKIPVLLIASCTVLLAKTLSTAFDAGETPILGNYPDTSLLLSTNTVVMPTAAPTNATSMNVSASTNFKGRLEGDPLTGVVRVTDAHPAGTYTLVVKAFDGVGASATQTFTLTVSTPVTCNPVRLAATDFGAGFYPSSIAVGDFNGDGSQDLATANQNSDNVSILLGNNTGSFSAPTNFGGGGGNGFASVAVGDFNGDGKQDLATANFGSNSVSILLGNGAGSFGTPTNFAAGNYPSSIAVGDFNGDGNQDLATNNGFSHNVTILLGNGAGTFSIPTNFVAGGEVRSVAVGDFNGDGKQDLATANDTNNVSILLGNGAGSFGTPTNFAAGNPGSFAVGDFNGDGKQDLAITNAINNVSILLGNGAGSFGTPTNFAAGNNPSSIAVGDFNGDGNQDLAVANQSSNSVSILLGNGAGSFGTPTNFAVGTEPLSAAVGDFNGDGLQDLAVANSGNLVPDDSSVSILLRVCELTVTSAVSRERLFDINLPLTGSPGIECRSTGGTNDYTMIVAFSGAVTVTGNPQAQVTSGTGCVGSAGTCTANGMVTISSNTVTVPLTNVANTQTISVTLNGVSGLGNVVIPMRLLTGDLNGNGVVNASDVAFAKSRVGQAIDRTNFKADVNVNGGINATDVSLVKSRVGTGILSADERR